MFDSIDKSGTDNSSLSPAELLAGKASRFLLLFLCASAVGLFPVALAVRASGLLLQ